MIYLPYGVEFMPFVRFILLSIFHASSQTIYTIGLGLVLFSHKASQSNLKYWGEKVFPFFLLLNFSSFSFLFKCNCQNYYNIKMENGKWKKKCTRDGKVVRKMNNCFLSIFLWLGCNMFYFWKSNLWVLDNSCYSLSNVWQILHWNLLQIFGKNIEIWFKFRLYFEIF